MDPRSRRAAELAMARRDRRDQGARRGARAARRDRGRFLDFDDDGDMEDEDGPDAGLLSGLKPRARRAYDERPDIDDMQGNEDVGAHCPQRAQTWI
jgi:DNA replication licensing factor MCM2